MNQVFRQEIYGQHHLLNQNPPYSVQHQQSSDNFSLLSNSNNSNNDSELQPRSLSASLLTSTANSNTLLTQQLAVQPYTLSSTQSVSSPRDTVQTKPTIHATSHTSLNVITNNSNSNNAANSNGNNIIVGSYHSVSDISVLSDNDNDDSCSAYFLNSNRNNANANKVKNTKLLSHSDDFEFLRPKDPLVLPQIASQSSGHISSAATHHSNLSSASMSRLETTKYNQNLYSSNNSLSSSLSSSYSPVPSYNNSMSANLPSNQAWVNSTN